MKGRERMPKWKTQAAQRMRRFPTPSERHLWEALRKKQVLGARFRQQAPLYGYIADFYCPALDLVVEVDGPSHSETVTRDSQRDRNLAWYGITTLRFTAQQVLVDRDSVVAEIASFIALTIQREAAA